MTAAVHAGTATTRSTRRTWFLASFQFAYVVWFGVCVWVALARAAHFAGHVYIPYESDPYTASVDIWTGWASWSRGPMMTTVVLQPFVELVLIGVSGWTLAQKRTRSNKTVFSVLLISTVLVVGCLVLGMLPAGTSISTWILD